MTVLRELKDPHSRFKPYIDIFPSPSEVLNSCNMDRKYIPMWKSEYWVRGSGRSRPHSHSHPPPSSPA